jgi:hypothetical protein
LNRVLVILELVVVEIIVFAVIVGFDQRSGRQ